MAALTDFHPFIAPYVDGAPTLVINRALVAALTEFCQKVEPWRVTHSAAAVLDANNQYDLSAALPAGTMVARVVSCKWGDVMLDPSESVSDFSTTAGTPIEFGMSDTAELGLNPPAITADDLVAVIAVKPMPTCTVVDDLLLHDWSEQVAHGALYRLMAQPEKKWSDPNTASFHKQEFESAMVQGARTIRNGRLNAGRRTRRREVY
jgi:hypothetical protein